MEPVLGSGIVTDRDTSALIVVDMQNDFLAKGGYYDEKEKRERARRGKLSATDIDDLACVYVHPPTTCEIRDRYQAFVDAVSEVAATALDHGMTTVFVQAVYDPESCYRPPLFLLDPQRKDYGCHPGSWGADFVQPIKQLAADAHAKVVAKHTFDAFFETELRGFLRFKQVDTLYVAGLETNVCVLFTVCSALTNGFRTVIVADCVTTSEADVHAPALKIIEIANGRQIPKQQFLTLFER
jgi:nicotinamidase-related amidase